MTSKMSSLEKKITGTKKFGFFDGYVSLFKEKGTIPCDKNEQNLNKYMSFYEKDQEFKDKNTDKITFEISKKRSFGKMILLNRMLSVKSCVLLFLFLLNSLIICSTDYQDNGHDMLRSNRFYLLSDDDGPSKRSFRSRKKKGGKKQAELKKQVIRSDTQLVTANNNGSEYPKNNIRSVDDTEPATTKDESFESCEEASSSEENKTEVFEDCVDGPGTSLSVSEKREIADQSRCAELPNDNLNVLEEKDFTPLLECVDKLDALAVSEEKNETPKYDSAKLSRDFSDVSEETALTAQSSCEKSSDATSAVLIKNDNTNKHDFLESLGTSSTESIKHKPSNLGDCATASLTSDVHTSQDPILNKDSVNVSDRLPGEPEKSKDLPLLDHVESEKTSLFVTEQLNEKFNSESSCVGDSQCNLHTRGKSVNKSQKGFGDTRSKSNHLPSTSKYKKNHYNQHNNNNGLNSRQIPCNDQQSQQCFSNFTICRCYKKYPFKNQGPLCDKNFGLYFNAFVASKRFDCIYTDISQYYICNINLKLYESVCKTPQITVFYIHEGCCLMPSNTARFAFTQYAILLINKKKEVLEINVNKIVDTHLNITYIIYFHTNIKIQGNNLDLNNLAGGFEQLIVRKLYPNCYVDYYYDLEKTKDIIDYTKQTEDVFEYYAVVSKKNLPNNALTLFEGFNLSLYLQFFETDNTWSIKLDFIADLDGIFI